MRKYVTLYSIDFKQVYTVERLAVPSAYAQQNWPLKDYFLSSSSQNGEYLRLNIDHTTKAAYEEGIELYHFENKEEFLKKCEELIKPLTYKQNFDKLINEGE